MAGSYGRSEGTHRVRVSHPMIASAKCIAAHKKRPGSHVSPRLQRGRNWASLAAARYHGLDIGRSGLRVRRWNDRWTVGLYVAISALNAVLAIYVVVEAARIGRGYDRREAPDDRGHTR